MIARHIAVVLQRLQQLFTMTCFFRVCSLFRLVSLFCNATARQVARTIAAYTDNWSFMGVVKSDDDSKRKTTTKIHEL